MDQLNFTLNRFTKILFICLLVLSANYQLNAQPTITSFSPTSATVYSSVTISGTNFNATAANNIVFFGSTKAIVTAATTTSLTVTVPSGATYAPITVLNTATALTAYSLANFNPIYAPAKTGITSTDFQQKVNFATPSSPNSPVIGDLDGDGKSDLVVVCYSYISVFRNISSMGSIGVNSFAAPVNFSFTSSPEEVAIGDLDGDGKLDLAVVVGTIGGEIYSHVSVLRNTSTIGSITTGSFAASVDFTTGRSSRYVAIGDLDGDGKLDLAVTNGDGNNVSVLRNTSTSGSIVAGSFAARVDFATEYYPGSVAIGDLDGDSKPDLVIRNYSGNSVSVLRNTSTSGSIVAGSFAARVNFATGSAPYSLAIGDLDGDGKLDLALANSAFGANSVSVLHNTSTSGNITSGSFANRLDFPAGGYARSVAIGDLDGDGKPDLVTVGGLATVSVLRNTSISGSIVPGSFAPRVDFGSSNTDGLAIGDLDGDDKPDMVVTNNGQNTFSVYRNANNNANLSALTTTAGTISPSFAAATTAYTTNVSNTTTRVTVTPTVADPTATVEVRVNGLAYTTVTSGTASTALSLNVGTNPIDIKVTAQNGATIKIYTITITRAIGPPTITSFSPTSAKPNDVVTITGTSFNTTPPNNIVFFGATRATVSASTSTSITATVPTGATYAPISVLNTATVFTASSLTNFNPIYTPAKTNITVSNFQPKVAFTTGTAPQSVAIGDLDGDGKSDLAVANNISNTISVFRNTSTSGSIATGSFASRVNFAAGSNPYSLAIGDLDGDGKPDLVVVNYSSNTVSVLRNTSTSGSIVAGSFTARVDFATGNNPYSVAIGDLDGDGKLDLAVANANSNTVSVLRNTSTSGSIVAGSFAAKEDFTTGLYPLSVAIGDLDGDGKLDLALANMNSSTVSVLRNTSSSGSIVAGSFATSVDFATGANPYSVTIGDLNEDGKLDLAVANNSSNTVSVLLNTSTSGSIATGSFNDKIDFTTSFSPQSVSIGDLDGDGKPDLVVPNNSSNTLSLLRNTSTTGSPDAISFATEVNLTTGSGSRSVAIGDLDGDGKPDLAVANHSLNSLSVFRNADIPTWDGSTWLGGTPAATTDAIIASSTAPASFTSQALTINSTFALTTTGITATVNGDIINNGNGIAGTGDLVVAANSSISGNIISFNGTLTVNSGVTLTTNNKLTISSNASSTGRIANSAGTISGNVTVERYIPAGKRGFRFLTPSVTTTSTIKANWQEGATSATSNPTPGYGTHITGTTIDQTNGFDGTTTGNASLFLFNNTTQAWSSISNTNVNTLTSGNAYRLLVRGDRASDLTTQPATNTATTLRATGTVTTGTVTLGTASSTPAAMPTLASNANEFSLVGNPYVSPIDWNALSKTGLTGYYYIWDPTLATRGAYVSCFTDGTKSNASSAVTTAIQSGQAFFVQNTSGASSRQLVITEANKTTGNTNVFRTQTGTSSLSVQLYLTSTLNTGTSQDGTTVLFNSTYNNAVNDDDAVKFTNQDENIAIQKGTTSLSIERRSLSASNDTVYLKMWQMTQNNYTFKIDASNFDATQIASLVDNYLNTETPISLTGTTSINFTTSSNAGSIATNRFSIVFKSSNALPTTFLNVTAIQKNAGIEVNWNTANETNMDSYEVEESSDGTNFIKATAVAAKNATSNMYTWFDGTVVNGNNYYRIKAIEKNGMSKYSNVLKVNIGAKGAEFTVYPNPVKGGTINLQMTNVEKGIYTLRIYNNIGQEVSSKTINHNGGSGIQTIDLGKSIAQGTYSIQITNGTTTITRTVVVE